MSEVASRSSPTILSRYITTWRCAGKRVLDWEHHVSEDRREAETVVANLKEQGVIQWHKFRLGETVAELSADFATPTTPDTVQTAIPAGLVRCEDCKGTGWDGGEQPRNKAGEFIGDLEDACVVCGGTGHAKPTLPNTDKREAIARAVTATIHAEYPHRSGTILLGAKITDVLFATGLIPAGEVDNEAGWDGVEMPFTLALELIDGEAPEREPLDGPTVGFPPSGDPECDDGNDVVREAFSEGVIRGRWEAAKIARAALAPSPVGLVDKRSAGK